MIRLRAIVTAVATVFAAAVALSGRPVLSADYEPYFSRRSDLAPIEGVWLMSADGALIAIAAMPGDASSYSVTLIDSPDFTIEPGTPLGQLSPMAKTGVYDLSLAAVPGLKRDFKDKLGRRMSYVLEMVENGRFTLSAYHRGKRISLRRWLPYLFRVSVVENATRPEGLDGAVRIYPPSEATLEPTVL